MPKKTPCACVFLLSGLSTKIKKKVVKELSCARLTKRFLPITDWLFMNYQWKSYLPADLLAGLNMAVMQVPSGKVTCP